MDNKEFLKSKTQELFELLGIQAEINVDSNEENSYSININSPSETGLLIGYRGENINSLQTIMGLMYKKEFGEWGRILINIGDYRQKQEEKLHLLADQAIDHALESEQPQPIYNLTPSQRRIIHLYISNRDDVVSESQGEEPERYLVIKKK